MQGSPSARAAKLSQLVGVARSSASHVDGIFDAVTLQDYKDVATGPTYYDTADEVDEAVAQAEEEDNRFDIAKERAEQLIAVYNAFVPWVLRMCNKRIDDLEESVHGQRRGSVGAAQAAEDEEQLGAIVQTLQCLSANVEEARTFLGKMGKTKEGAYDASVTQLASDEVSGGLAPRHTKARKTKGIFTAGQRTHSGSEIEALESQNDEAVFFQKQRGAFCGVCSLNNMLGRRAVSYREAELLADSVWLQSVLSEGCGVHFAAPRLCSRRREFPFDGFIDFVTMNKLCLMHGVKLRELNRFVPARTASNICSLCQS